VSQLPTLPAPATAERRDASIHPLSAVLLITVDNLWMLADWAAFAWIITIPLSFVAVSLPVYLIQRHFRGDSPGRAIAIASLLGVLAAVPTPITGTATGLVVLGYAGLRSLRPGRRSDPVSGPPPGRN
jgi:hypothetical protein